VEDKSHTVQHFRFPPIFFLAGSSLQDKRNNLYFAVKGEIYSPDVKAAACIEKYPLVKV